MNDPLEPEMTEPEPQAKRPLRRRRQRLALSLRHLLEMLKSGDDFRARKVRRMRAAIRAGHYENDLKLTIAIDRMARDL